MAGFRRRHLARVLNPQRVRGPKNALTASGQRVKSREADSMRRLAQPWQSRAFAYYDLLGEIKYSAQFYSRMLQSLRLYPAELDDKGDWVETTDQDAVAGLDRIQDPGGGRTGLLSSYGRLMFLTGEADLLVTQNPETREEQWEMLSTDELRISSGTYYRYRAPSLAAEEYREPTDDDFEPMDGKTAVAYRLWKRHPRFSMLADAPMQGVLDLAEELVLLTQAVRSRARSRLAGAGILLVDESISVAKPLEPVPDEDMEEDPFMADLVEAMTASMVDEGAASGIVPLVLRVPAGDNRKVADLIHHLQIVDPTQLYPETGLRMECIKRIAIGLDMPAEVLTGTGGLNHWNGWLLDEQAWKNHGQPIAQQLCDDLNSAYFRPWLRELGRKDAQRFAIAYDASAVVNNPDRSKDAKDLYSLRAIGKTALRDSNGFAEEDAPTEQELYEMIGVATNDSQLAITGEPRAEPSPVGSEPESAGEIGAAETVKAPPTPPAERNGEGLEASAYSARLIGAAELALLRSREAAGNRLRSKARRDPEMLELVTGVRPGQIAATLGADAVRKLGAGPDRELVAGVSELILDALRVWGISDDVAARIAEQLEVHAARTLYQMNPSPLPRGFENYIAGLTNGAGP